MVNVSWRGIVPGFIGGLIIGLSTTLHLYLKGRVTGMSGILNGLLRIDDAIQWKSALISGLIFTSCIGFYIFEFDEIAKDFYIFDPPQLFHTNLGSAILVIAGFLVGFGTKLGNGCTSGHGMCGLPRLSIRSIAAVLTFMGTGFIMANISYYAIHENEYKISERTSESQIPVHIAVAFSMVLLLVNIWKNKKGAKGLQDMIISFIVGVLFAIGLLVSGMTRRSKVMGFLTFNEEWDISLMFVMGGGVLLNFFTFQYIIKVKQKPLMAEKLCLPTNTKTDWKLFGGAAIFGLGWGLGGICPGPAILVTPIYFVKMVQFSAAMIAGQYLVMFLEMKVFDKAKIAQKK